MRRHILLAVLALASTSRSAPAQSGPEAAAQAFGAAIKTNDWPAAARLTHPGALRQLRGLFEPLLASPGSDQIGEQLFGIHSGAELATTPDIVLFTSFLRNVLARQEGVAEALRTATFTPLGHVPGGADTVLLVSRMSLAVQGVMISQFEVMPFILENGHWWGLLKVDFTNMAAMLQRALGARRS